MSERGQGKNENQSNVHKDLLRFYEEINKIINGEMKLSDLLDSRLSTNEKDSNQIEEFLFLRNDLAKLNELIKKLTALERRQLFLRREFLGFSQWQLIERYSMHADFFRIFKGTKRITNKPKRRYDKTFIRLLIKHPRLHVDYLNFIAFICRIPYHWLLTDYYIEEWDDDHGDFFISELHTKSKFREYLLSIGETEHDVSAIYVNLGRLKKRLHLRFEVYRGTICVELMNKDCNMTEYLDFIHLYHGIPIIEGFMKTILQKQLNPAFIYQHPKYCKYICYPIEFIPKDELI
jgi:hypothetical protein